MSFDLTQQEGEFIVRLARDAVAEYLKTRKCFQTPKNTPEKLKQNCGVFVTINALRHGEKELRGCIGYPYPTDPLVEALISSAISAATQDPRFNRLSTNELENVVFEVSVLTPPEQVKTNKPNEYLKKIRIGQDGLIIERGTCRGLLLPQVPVEWHWDEEEFLCQCCLKAGLSADNWLLSDTKIYKFQAVIFEEETPNGHIERKAIAGK